MKKITSESPCIGICLIIDNGMDEFCEGCGRTLTDIEQWHILDDESKIERNKKALNRLQDD